MAIPLRTYDPDSIKKILYGNIRDGECLQKVMDSLGYSGTQSDNFTMFKQIYGDMNKGWIADPDLQLSASKDWGKDFHTLNFLTSEKEATIYPLEEEDYDVIGKNYYNVSNASIREHYNNFIRTKNIYKDLKEGDVVQYVDPKIGHCPLYIQFKHSRKVVVPGTGKQKNIQPSDFTIFRFPFQYFQMYQTFHDGCIAFADLSKYKREIIERIKPIVFPFDMGFILMSMFTHLHIFWGVAFIVINSELHSEVKQLFDLSAEYLKINFVDDAETVVDILEDDYFGEYIDHSIDYNVLFTNKPLAKPGEVKNNFEKMYGNCKVIQFLKQYYGTKVPLSRVLFVRLDPSVAK